MDVTRRSFIKFSAGFAAGTIVSPLPWKLLDDASIWSQNWPWIARTPHGPVTLAHTTCTLCAAGCGLRVRLVGPHPVSAWSEPGHPTSGGSVCPLGLGAAQVRYHPLRIRGPVCRDLRGGGATWRLTGRDEVLGAAGRKVAELRSAGALGRLAILDLRPGRALSAMHREFLDRVGGGRYLTLPDGRDLSASALDELVDTGGRVPGYDLAGAGAVVSFGTPLLDGWCGAGPDPELARRRRAGDAPFLVQIESNASTTALHADRWLHLRPGTETVQALALAHAARAAGMVPAAAIRALDAGPLPGYADLVRTWSPEAAAGITGIPAPELRAVARDLARHRPVVFVAGGDPGGGPLGQEEERAVWALNLLFGAVGRPGGVALRHRPDAPNGAPAAESMRDIPDGSLDLLLVDASAPGTVVPPGLLRSKLASDGSLMVGLSAFAGGAVSGADMILPVPAPGEWLDDVTDQALASQGSYAWTPPVADPLPWARHPADLLDGVAEAAGLATGGTRGKARHEAHLRDRIAALAAAGQGQVFEPKKGKARSARGLSARELGRLFREGACWVDGGGSRGGPPSLRKAPPAGRGPGFETAAGGRPTAADNEQAALPLILMIHGQQGLSGPAVVPPVLTKLCRESHLLPDPGRARLNPATARSHGLGHELPADLSTSHGRLRVTVVHDENVMPGVVRLAAGPDTDGLGEPGPTAADVLSAGGAGSNAVWRLGRAALQEVKA